MFYLGQVRLRPIFFFYRWVPRGVGVERGGGPNPEKVGGGFHTTAREPKRAHLRVLFFKKPTKIPRERSENGSGRGKKRANFWAVRWRGGPVEGGPGQGVRRRAAEKKKKTNSKKKEKKKKEQKKEVIKIIIIMGVVIVVVIIIIIRNHSSCHLFLCRYTQHTYNAHTKKRKLAQVELGPSRTCPK